jgi:hypothetical protein
MQEPNYQDDLAPFSDLPVVYGIKGKIAIDDQEENGGVIIYTTDEDDLINEVELDPKQLKELIEILTSYAPGSAK